jgi:hypothetical protein
MTPTMNCEGITHIIAFTQIVVAIILQTKSKFKQILAKKDLKKLLKTKLVTWSNKSKPEILKQQADDNIQFI